MNVLSLEYLKEDGNVHIESTKVQTLRAKIPESLNSDNAHVCNIYIKTLPLEYDGSIRKM